MNLKAETMRVLLHAFAARAVQNEPREAIEWIQAAANHPTMLEGFYDTCVCEPSPLKLLPGIVARHRNEIRKALDDCSWQFRDVEEAFQFFAFEHTTLVSMFGLADARSETLHHARDAGLEIGGIVFTFEE